MKNIESNQHTSVRHPFEGDLGDAFGQQGSGWFALKAVRVLAAANFVSTGRCHNHHLQNAKKISSMVRALSAY